MTIKQNEQFKNAIDILGNWYEGEENKHSLFISDDEWVIDNKEKNKKGIC